MAGKNNLSPNSILDINPGIVQPDYDGYRTIVLIPSITLGEFSYRYLSGLRYYEERYLYYLTYLKNPRTHLVVVLSIGLELSLLEYFYQHCCQAIGLTRRELLKRFKIIWVEGGGQRELTQNILRQEGVQKEIMNSINDPEKAYLEFWRVEKSEIDLARVFGIPYYGLSPQSIHVNTKSNARALFRKSGLAVPPGEENVYSLKQAHRVLQGLCQQSPAVYFLIKMNHEGGGLGIIKVSRKDCQLSYDKFLSKIVLPEGQSLNLFQKYYAHEQGVVEEFIEADFKESPSVQFEITPDGQVVDLASHLQIIAGTNYVGAEFPAPAIYRQLILRAGRRVAQEIGKLGGRGFIAMDFLVTSNKNKKTFKVWGIEINARKGGTNHTHLWAKYLTNAVYNTQRGILESSRGDVCYKTSEHFVQEEWLKKVRPEILLKTIKDNRLDFNHQKKSGVFVHLLSTLPHFGKFGVTVIGHSREAVNEYWEKLGKMVDKLNTKNPSRVRAKN